MSPEKIAEFAARHRGEGEVARSFDEHLDAVRQLALGTNFNIDVVSDITPEILDGTKRKGVKAFQFWQDLYKGLAEHARYTAILRYSTSLVPNMNPPFHSIDTAYIRIYEGLAQDDLRFIKGNDTRPSEVNIAAPSTVLSLRGIKNDVWARSLLPLTATGLLALEDGVDFSELLLEPQVLFGNEDLLLDETRQALELDGELSLTILQQLDSWEQEGKITKIIPLSEQA